MKTILSRWLPVAFWMGVIFFSSSQSHLPGPKDQVQEFVMKKAGHVFVYAILALLLYRATRDSKHPILYSLAITILYAISDEYHQSFVPLREPTVRDVIIDTVAGGLALLAAEWLRRRTNRTADAKQPINTR